MFESIACECYGLLTDSLEARDISRLPSKVVEDWWEILENHSFELSDESNLALPGISSSACYRSSLLQHIQAIRNIPHRDFDVLREEIFATDPFHVTYHHFGSQLQKLPEAEISVPSQLTPLIKPEIKIRFTLSRGHPPPVPDQESTTEGEEDIISQQQTTKRKPKIKFKLSYPVAPPPPPPPSSSRASRKATSSSSPSSAAPLPSPPLSRTRGKRLPLSFLQSVTDIDVDHLDDANPSQDLALDTTAAGVGDADTWIDESEDQDFLDDQETQEQLRTDHIADFLDEDEYEAHHSKGSSNRKRRLSGERGSTPAATPSSQPRKMKQKLGPGALLRKKLSGKH